jgi:hypothetical protein
MHRKHILPCCLIIVALVVIFFFEFIFCGKAYLSPELLNSDPLFRAEYHQSRHNFQTGDIMGYTYPREVMYNEQVKSGHLPLWNPRIFSGMPMGIDARNGVFYPFHIFFSRFWGPQAAHGLLIMIHFLIAGLAMFFLALDYECSPRASLAASLIWMFSGMNTAWMEWTEFISMVAYFPLIFLFFRKSLREKNSYYAAVAGLLLGLSLLYAHFQLSLYFLIFAGCYGLYLSATKEAAWRELLCTSGIMLAMGAGISAIQMGPTFELLGSVHRTEFTWQEIVKSYSVPFWSMPLLLICPDMFGNPALGIHFFLRGTVYYEEICCYAGILALPFLIAGLSSRGKETRFYSAAILLCLFFASATWLYYPLFRFVPFFNKIIPGRIVIIMLFSIAILASKGFDEYERGTLSRRAMAWALGSLFTFYLLFFLATVLLHSEPGLFIPLLKKGVAHIQYPFVHRSGEAFYIEYLQAVQGYYSPGNIWLFLPALLLGPGALLLMLERKLKIPRGISASLLLVIMACDLILFGLKFNPVVERRPLEAPAALKWLGTKEKPFRVLNLASPSTANLVGAFGFDTVGGFMPLYPKRYQLLMSRIETGFVRDSRVIFGNLVSLRDYRSPALDMLNDRYIIMGRESKVEDGNLDKVYDGEVRIYENRKSMPRAWLVAHYEVLKADAILDKVTGRGFKARDIVYLETEPAFPEDLPGDGAQADLAEFKYYAYDHVALKVRTSARALLVLSDNHFPGWHVQVDGREGAIYCADYTLRAVPLGRGSHTVRFSFRPWAASWGAAVTLGTLIFFVVLTGLYVRGVGKRGSPAHPVETSAFL